MGKPVIDRRGLAIVAIVIVAIGTLVQCKAGIEAEITARSPQDLTITFDRPDGFEVDIGTMFSVSISESFDSYAWVLDGVTVAGQTASTISLDSGAMSPGVHHLIAVVTTDGGDYSKALRFLVES